MARHNPIPTGELLPFVLEKSKDLYDCKLLLSISLVSDRIESMILNIESISNVGGSATLTSDWGYKDNDYIYVRS